MLTTINNIDMRIINFFQKISDRLQDNVGIDSIMISKFLLVGFAVSGLFGLSIKYNIYTDANFPTFEIISIFICILYFGYEIRRIENQYMNSDFMNSFVLRWSFFRPLNFILGLLSTIECLGHIFFGVSMFTENEVYVTNTYRAIWVIDEVAFTLLLYFLSCTPKPPKKSKLQKFVEGLSSSKKVVVAYVKT